MAASEYTWVAHPDLVVQAIKMLALVVGVLGSAALSLLLFIDRSRMQKINEMAADIKSIATALTESSIEYEHRLTGLESRVNTLENDSTDIKRLCENRRQNNSH